MDSDDLFGLFSSLDDTPVEREDYVRFPFPYVGAKGRSLKQLMPLLPHTDTWVDAFGGSGAVTLARRPCRFEVFNDRHAGIVSFYRCLREYAKKEALCERLGLTVHSREEYIWSQDTWEHSELDDVERAARWYYTVAYSFGGVGRNFGRSRDSRTVFSGKIADKLPLFQPIHQRFQRVQVENLDWRQVLKDYDSDATVFYLDPPYYGKNVYKHNMRKAEHVEMCRRIFDCRGFVALSGYVNEVYDAFPWDNKHEWDTHVTVTSRAVTTDTSNVTSRGISEAKECLWVKEFS